jgi:ribonuclease T
MSSLKNRFNNYLPVVVDVETGGVNAQTDALLEVAAVFLDFNTAGILEPTSTVSVHVEPLKGLIIHQKSLDITGIKPDHPFRFAEPEDKALHEIFSAVKKARNKADCKRAMLIGHNAHFDLNFINAACARQEISSPFHSFSVMDTVTLGMLAYKSSVLAKILQRAAIKFDESEAHSARYDAEKTAELFCKVFNAQDKHQ